MIRDRLRSLARKVLDRPGPGVPPSGPAPATVATAAVSTAAAAPPSGPAPAPPLPEDEGPELEVEATEVRKWIADGRDVLLLDIREPYELQGGYAEGALCIPMNSVPDRLAELPQGRVLAIYCAAGVRSFGVAHWLRERGYEAWSLPGGFGSWVEAGGAWRRPE